MIDHLGLWALGLCLAAVGWSCTDDRHASRFVGLDALLDSVIAEHGVPGVALASFDDRGVLYAYETGIKSADSGAAVDAETAFEAASISKPVFAYIVLTLARDGAVDLDAALPEPVPELAYDPRSRALTPRVLLTHQGGLPNWRSRLRFDAESYDDLFPPGDTLRFARDPGTGFRYSGEGYVLLQRVVEEATGKGLDALAHEMVFDPLGMTRSSFRFDDLVRTNASMGHHADGRPDKWVIELPLASSTLHTTARDLALFGVHLADGIRRSAYFAAMAEPAVEIDEENGFTRSWGLGLGHVADDAGTYVYHGGNNVIFIADFVYAADENLGYALLTNSANGPAIVDAVERFIYGRDLPR